MKSTGSTIQNDSNKWHQMEKYIKTNIDKVEVIKRSRVISWIIHKNAH